MKSRNLINDSTIIKIPDGAYKTMIQRLKSLHNPNLFLMLYFKDIVKNLIFIPNYFFVSSIIEERKPLKPTAKRAGWIGCNINYSDIPRIGKIYIVKDCREICKTKVLDDYNQTVSLRSEEIESRGWLMDVLSCVDKLTEDDFNLSQIYKFADTLRQKHPYNNHIKDKIRQQLQYLRDKGFIEFTSRGKYKKIRY